MSYKSKVTIKFYKEFKMSDKKLVLGRMQDLHEGFILQSIEKTSDGEEKTENLIMINGNRPSYTGPVALLYLDPYVTFGMSHISVVSRILHEGKGSQKLLTSKEIFHNLYEHGMKASWRYVNVNNLRYMTFAETFYELIGTYKEFKIITGTNELGKSVGLLYNNTTLFHGEGFMPNTELKDIKKVNIDKVRDFCYV